MKGVIISIGDELLVGQTNNTNATWLAEKLTEAGVEVGGIVSVGDVEPEIEAVIEHALKNQDIVVVTGGLGPTHDDVTREALSRVARVELALHEEVEQDIRQKLAGRGRALTEMRRRMAFVPAGFQVFTNPIGLAPGLLWTPSDHQLLVGLPGVPSEMKAIVEQHLLPLLGNRTDTRIARRRTLLTAGVTESRLAEMLDEPRKRWPESASIAYLPGYRTGVRMRVTATGSEKEQVERDLAAVVDEIAVLTGAFLYGYDDDTLEAVVGRLLVDRKATIAVAESCTGGLALDRLTDVPGSSEYVLGGVVAYSDDSKVELLGVDEASIREHGAVSRTVATLLAKNVRNRFASSIGLSATGVAGPGGGTPDKPVGTVWIGFADERQESAVKLQLTTDRRLNKEMAATALLRLLWTKLKSDI